MCPCRVRGEKRGVVVDKMEEGCEKRNVPEPDTRESRDLVRGNRVVHYQPNKKGRTTPQIPSVFSSRRGVAWTKD